MQGTPVNPSSHPETAPSPALDQQAIRPSSVTVFEYLDYHVFLREWIDAKKADRSTYSYQELANRARMKSRSFLRMVAMGERDLLHAAAVRLSEAMGLTARESEYFLALVGYNNASDPWERNLYLAKLKAINKPSQRKILSTQQFLLFSEWYIIPIWELVTSKPFGNDFKSLGQLLDPTISPEEARNAIAILLELDLIEPEGDKYAQKEYILHTKDELVSATIKSYQAKTIDLAQNALSRMPTDLRNIGTLTLGLDADSWIEIQEEMKFFRQKIIDISAKTKSPDRVYQLNFQAFPLTKIASR
ncbi:MAG: TIGR02147 family protein [Fibrobacterota bacterium]|nr:MAG: TIGR02147 family protein [Fibrobacterota bacterium]